ncbi:hypothetical protein SBA4_1890010 [Candidatus Sulfopaludibacter sp. SbA4]|nr:hypothetical protein SBA4_1890010 [Candidatus Sulfopaludibacter sp. SbA4]
MRWCPVDRSTQFFPGLEIRRRIVWDRIAAEAAKRPLEVTLGPALNRRLAHLSFDRLQHQQYIDVRLGKLGRDSKLQRAVCAHTTLKGNRNHDRNLHPNDNSRQAAEWVDVVASQKVGRNDPCPCGSGKKYKKCHGAG